MDKYSTPWETLAYIEALKPVQEQIQHDIDCLRTIESQFRQEPLSTLMLEIIRRIGERSICLKLTSTTIRTRLNLYVEYAEDILTVIQVLKEFGFQEPERHVDNRSFITWPPQDWWSKYRMELASITIIDLR